MDTALNEEGAQQSSMGRLRLVTVSLALLSILYAMVTVKVREGHSELITQFGEPVRVIEQPGLYLKLPWPIQASTAIDRRRRLFETKQTEMLTKDKRNVVLLSFVLWSVEKPLAFYQAVGSMESAEEKLNGLVTNAQIGVLGGYELRALASTDPSTLQVDAIEQALLAKTKAAAREQYGITLHQIGFSRLSLPKQNIRAVFTQMRAERKQYAAEYQAKGEAAAAKIRAQTDLEVATLRAKTTEEVAQITGAAEADAARIYAEAHRQDPELYKFIRSMDTLEEVIGARSSLILRTDSAPFELLIKPEER